MRALYTQLCEKNNFPIAIHPFIKANLCASARGLAFFMSLEPEKGSRCGVSHG